VHLSGALEWPSKRSDRTFGNRHVICAVEVKQSQGILGAVVYIGIAANARHCKEIDLWSHHRAGNC
jgi:hypothetical protein